MKKIIALTLAVFMLIGMLAGCEINSNTGSGSSNNKTQAPTQAQTQAPTQAQTQAPTQAQTQAPTQGAVGDILDAPEVAFDESIEDLYIYYTYPGETEDEVLSMEIAFDQVTEDTYVIYATDGLLKLDEIVYEVTDTGITKYYKDVFMEKFEQVTDLSADDLQTEVDSMFDLLTKFMIIGDDWANVKFQKNDDIAFSLTGDVYTYDMIENGTVSGKVWIDADTGLLSKLMDTDDNYLIWVQEIKTSDLEIPEYK